MAKTIAFICAIVLFIFAAFGFSPIAGVVMGWLGLASLTLALML